MAEGAAAASTRKRAKRTRGSSSDTDSGSAIASSGDYDDGSTTMTGLMVAAVALDLSTAAVTSHRAAAAATAPADAPFARFSLWPPKSLCLDDSSRNAIEKLCEAWKASAEQNSFPGRLEEQVIRGGGKRNSSWSPQVAQRRSG